MILRIGYSRCSLCISPHCLSAMASVARTYFVPDRNRRKTAVFSSVFVCRAIFRGNYSCRSLCISPHCLSVMASVFTDLCCVYPKPAKHRRFLSVFVCRAILRGSYSCRSLCISPHCLAAMPSCFYGLMLCVSETCETPPFSLRFRLSRVILRGNHGCVLCCCALSRGCYCRVL